MKLTAPQIGLAICSFLAGFLACYLWLGNHHAPVSLNSPTSRGMAHTTNLQPLRAPERSMPGGPADPPPDRGPVTKEVVGIGAAIHFEEQTGTIRIMDVVPNSPAEQAGLSAGLIIQKIDDALTTGMRLPECVERIRGPVGTKVRLELVDPDGNATNTVELTRQKLQL